LSQLPYEYYALPFCQPADVVVAAENLGEVLRGDRIMNSNYELKMGVEESCKILCKKQLTASETAAFALRIEQDYRVHWVMDNLPSATKYVDETNPAKPVTIYDLGFPLGFRGSADIPGTSAGVSYLNNHLLLTVKFHKDESSFEVRRWMGALQGQTSRIALLIGILICMYEYLAFPFGVVPRLAVLFRASATRRRAAGVICLRRGAREPQRQQEACGAASG